MTANSLSQSTILVLLLLCLVGCRESSLVQPGEKTSERGTCTFHEWKGPRDTSMFRWESVDGPLALGSQLEGKKATIISRGTDRRPFLRVDHRELFAPHWVDWSADPPGCVSDQTRKAVAGLIGRVGPTNPRSDRPAVKGEVVGSSPTWMWTSTLVRIQTPDKIIVRPYVADEWAP